MKFSEVHQVKNEYELLFFCIILQIITPKIMNKISFSALLVSISIQTNPNFKQLLQLKLSAFTT